MASELVGSAHVDIDINPSPAEAALARLEAKADRTFAELGRKRAEASLDVKTTEFDRKIDKAKGELANLEGKHARVGVSLKGDIEKEIAEVKAEIKQLDREKATIKVDSRQLKAANKEQRLLSQARALDERHALAQAKAERALTTERSRAVQAMQREGKIQARAAAENAKFDADRVEGAIKSRAAIAKLSAEYEKLAGKQKALKKQASSVFSQRSIATTEREARKLERVGAEMEHVAHKIERLGGSVADLDPELRKNSNAFDRWLSRLGDTSIRIGPLTTSIKGLGVGLGLLGPLIFELGGGLASLIGFLGQGIAGASAVGIGALGGFALSAFGVGAVIKPMLGEFGAIKKASESLADAQLKYGKNSTQAQTAQEKLNHSLKGVSPAARDAFETYGQLGDRWRNLTKEAKPAVFNAFGQSLKTAQALLPAFASESVKTTQVAGKAWEGWMKSLRSSEAQNLLGGMMSDFRASIPGLADGLGSIGAMIGRIGAAGAHFLPGLSGGFAEWANNLERAVGSGDKLTGKVGGLVDSMQDFGHLTQDTGSFLVHFFGASANAGQGLSNSLDGVIKRWDKWTQSREGKKSLENFFSESQTATEDFMSSLGHFTELLFQFSRATAPLANGLLKVVTFMGDIVSAADGLVGVKNIFQGIGAALAGLWVTSKVTAYATAVKTTLSTLKGAAATMAGTNIAATAAGGAGMFPGFFGRGGARVATAESAAVARGLGAVAPAARRAETAGAMLATSFGSLVASMGASVKSGPLGRGASSVGGRLSGLAPKFMSLASLAGVFSAAMTPTVLIPAAAIGALALFIGKMEDSKTAFEEAHEAFMETEDMSKSIRQVTVAGEKYNESIHEQVSATEEVSNAKAHYLKLLDNGAPERKIIAALARLGVAEDQQADSQRNLGIERARNVKTDEKALATAKKRVNAAKAEERAARKTEPGLDNEGNVIQKHQSSTWERDLARAQRDRAAAQREVAATAAAMVVATLPLERQTKGLAPLTDRATDSLEKLSKTAGAQAAKKIGNFVDPKDVERAANLSNRLTKLGQGSTVKKIAVKSSGADETLGKLQRLQKQTRRVTTARLNVKTNSEGASQKLSRLSSLSQKVAGANPTIKILANADNAEQAINRLSSHLRQVAQRKYQARIDAIDQTTAPGSAARAKLTAIAQKKYQARLTAIDNASHPAAAARKALEAAGKQHPNPTITVNAAQALSSTQMVIGQLSALNGYTAHANVYVGLSGPGASKMSGRFMGGPSVYMPSFAVGGPSQDRLQRAAENAVLVPAGASRKVNKPTMLTGEEPGHPEYVIATNPAYRESNERYLESAAGDLGYEVIPAHKKGKGKKGKGKKKAASSSPADNRAEMLRRKPRGQRSGAGSPAKSAVFPGEGKLYNEQPINSEKAAIDRIEENYARQLDHQEREITAGRREAWDFGWFRENQVSERNARQRLQNVLVPQAIKQIDEKESKAVSYLTSGAGRPSNIKALKRGVNKADRAYDAIDRDDYAKGDEGSKAYGKARAEQKKVLEAAKRHLEKVERERKRAEKLKKLARTEKSKLRSEASAQDNPLSEAVDDIQYINDVESGAVDAPYAEAAGEKLIEEGEDFKRAKADLVAAGLRGDVPGEEAARARMIAITEREYGEAQGTPSADDDIVIGERLKSLREETKDNGGKGTIGEQTASSNEAREQLYQQFASNITGQIVPAAGALSSGGPPIYTPGGMTAMGAATPALQGGASTSAAGSGSIKVVNNFAAPPPDPHTWTRQQEFELGALS
jgi:hypothetical protein